MPNIDIMAETGRTHMRSGWLSMSAARRRHSSDSLRPVP